MMTIDEANKLSGEQSTGNLVHTGQDSTAKIHSPKKESNIDHTEPIIENTEREQQTTQLSNIPQANPPEAEDQTFYEATAKKTEE